MPPTLLLVEDDPLLADTLAATLATPEQQVEHIADGGIAAACLCEPHPYALVLLDLNLPTRSGLEVLATLRAVDRHTPVLILTARAAIEDRVKGLDLGADDYLAKPFALDELEARIPELLETVQQGLFDKAKRNLDEHTYAAHSLAEAKELQEKNGGFIKTMWCGDLACELEMKDKAGMSSRCIPFEQEHLDDVCPVCGKPAKCMIYWGVAY